MWPVDDGADELFAALGYNVKSSDMAEVAHKIQELEKAMENAEPKVLTSDAAVHYNPSDISSWLDSMISGFDDSLLDDFGSDLISIPGKAVYPKTLPPPPPPQPKKLKTTPDSGNPIVVIDSQENGVRLVHSLMACAEAVQKGNLELAKALVKCVQFLAVSQAGAMGKVATYFAGALETRIYRRSKNFDSAFADSLQMHFYEACPYLKFAHFTANQAILEAFAGKSRVHVIDFSVKQGMQWPALLQALARRPGGPPSFRLTAVGLSDDDKVLMNLARFAETIDVKFEGKSLADLTGFDVRGGETVAVNSIFELHPSLARPGELDKVLRAVRGLKPEILTVAEQEANHNGGVFSDRFTESLHYYSSMFDSLEGGAGDEDRAMSEVYLGMQICNVVACEGVDRVERHETLAQWSGEPGSGRPGSCRFTWVRTLMSTSDTHLSVSTLAGSPGRRKRSTAAVSPWDDGRREPSHSPEKVTGRRREHRRVCLV